jgi:DNA-binding transcriptional MerR regulator
MAYRRYTDKDRITALELLALGHSLSDVSRQLNIPVTTIHNWDKNKTEGAKEIKKELNSEELERIRKEKKEEFVAKANDIIKKGLSLLDKRITRALEEEESIDELIVQLVKKAKKGEEELNISDIKEIANKLKEMKVQRVSEITTAIGTLYDKQALAIGDATQNINGKLTLENLLDKVEGEEF